MITAFALGAILGSPVQDKTDFQLGWKQGDKFAYTVGYSGGGFAAQGRMDITVSKADDKGFTVSWPQFSMSGGAEAQSGGTVQMNRKGRVTTKGTVPEASSTLFQMALPLNPVAVGDEFKIGVAANGTRFDFACQLEKIDESKGREAHFVCEGTLHNPDGSKLPVKQSSVFDMVRGLFVSSELEIVGFGTKFYFKLLGDGSGNFGSDEQTNGQEPVDAWEKRLTNNRAYDGLPVFSWDGSKIAFVSNRDGSNEIYVMNADGTGQTRLTENEDYDGSPAFSPDGSKIAFESGRDGNWEVYVMNADGSGQTRLTDSEHYDGAPAFSPDGTKIAFGSRRDGNNEVYVMNADGTGQSRLTDNAVFDGAPTFSPDGKKIAYVSLYGGDYEIYVMNADGTGATSQTRTPPKFSLPRFSSNGSKIAFASSLETSYRDSEIYVMNADGSGVIRMRDNQAEDWNPAFSPDGTMIVFQTDRDGNAEIYLMNAVQEAWTVDHVVKATVSTEKPVYAVGEDITFGLRILNTSRGSFTIDSSFVRTWNFVLGVYDSDGNVVEYEGWNTTVRRAPSDSPSDFVMLDSGQYFGESSCAWIRIYKPGTYQIAVTVMLGRHAEYAEKLGILGYNRGNVSAESIYITVSGSGKQ